jgi:hypothetical protein
MSFSQGRKDHSLQGEVFVESEKGEMGRKGTWLIRED